MSWDFSFVNLPTKSHLLFDANIHIYVYTRATKRNEARCKYDKLVFFTPLALLEALRNGGRRFSICPRIDNSETPLEIGCNIYIRVPTRKKFGLI